MPALFNLQCARCTKLVTEYIAVGNEAVDAKAELNRAFQAGVRVLLSRRLEQALERRSDVRKRLMLHQGSHSLQ